MANDYWDYLEHGLWGSNHERKNHKYVARVPIGTDKKGNTKYRYFYDNYTYGTYLRLKGKGYSNLETDRGMFVATAKETRQEDKWKQQKWLKSGHKYINYPSVKMSVTRERNMISGKDRDYILPTDDIPVYEAEKKSAKFKTAVYEADRAVRKTKIAAKKGALTVKRLFKSLTKKKPKK